MTPLKNQNKLDYMAGTIQSYAGTGTGSSSQTVTSTIFNSSNYNTTKGVITIWCNINLQTPSGTSNATFLTINGTNFSGIDRVTRAITSYSDTETYIDTETISGSSLTYTRNTRLGSSLPYTPCKIEINYTNKMCEITLIKQYHFSSGSSSRSGYEDHKVFFSFDTLTTIQLSLNSQYSTAKVNIATSR